MFVQNLLKILFKTCSDHPVKESSTILSHPVNTNDKNHKLSCVIIGFLIMLNNLIYCSSSISRKINITISAKIF